MLRNSLLEKNAISKVKATATGFEPTTTKYVNEHSTTECRFILKGVCGMIRTYSPMHHTDKNSQHSSINWFLWHVDECSFTN